jgi:hypothetical protein
MGTEILDPGGCDKTTSGWSACGACSAGGESCTCEASSDCDSGTNVKSGARYYSFDSPVHQGDYTALNLKYQYKVWAHDGDDGTACNTSRMVIQYSTNGGSSWLSWDSVSAGGGSKTGTKTKSISTGTNIANVQIRMYAEAACCTPCESGPGYDYICEMYDGELDRTFCHHAEDCGDCGIGWDCSEGSCH